MFLEAESLQKPLTADQNRPPTQGHIYRFINPSDSDAQIYSSLAIIKQLTENHQIQEVIP
ncbi:hypothetical protein A3A71_01615 [Candidatus Berkelbacteria bacterium RIFCSPLOWO2_01_FULL_50_28]|uniref:Uncharacterized protein n=1 Tax=Candidatus Berkelbacteria bacterium RIFCSPLOWO2_01_FULL_50_28 TaxID=1797471 RepID=A0A1F5EBD6_9BACT|nr:MAG: hypothetical protein A3F39_01455 [Candidatus Berkelbacteria bacterium RIFCSPHIGHO2_12_FULL_50_11]OGD64732.1 MAG: hypothetical protein A3A71_01615 [Candidatus Berkelbacteria bacterium RIFCSPLOWO2_01_FULL_50_28]